MCCLPIEKKCVLAELFNVAFGMIGRTFSFSTLDVLFDSYIEDWKEGSEESWKEITLLACSELTSDVPEQSTVCASQQIL